MKIIIETIPHAEQRYETCGDWYWEGDTLQIKISKMSSWMREFFVAYHELFEAMWCKAKGVSQKAVDNFDIGYEKNRADDDESEPGDDPNAPYYRGHQLAMIPERLACIEFGDNWADYDEEVAALFQDD